MNKLVECALETQDRFKKGDYNVHVFIEETKGLLPVNFNKSFNPVIVVTCFGKTKCTRKQKNVNKNLESSNHAKSLFPVAILSKRYSFGERGRGAEVDLSL